MTLATSTGEMISGERRRSASEFASRVALASAGFAAMGLGAGDTVAILMRNDFAFLEATLAAQQVGCYPVPINWHSKGEEVQYVLQDCAARLLVGHADLLAGVADSLPAGIAIISVDTPPEIATAYRVSDAATRSNPGHHEWDAWLAGQDPAAARAGGAVRDSMIYTSGTTGRPKGVKRGVPGAAQSERVEAMRRRVYGFRPGMRTVLTAPMYHSAPNSYAVRAWRQASLMVLLPRFDPEALLQAIGDHRITHLFMVPTMFVRLLKLPADVRARFDVSSLEFVIHAGSPCPAAIKEAMIGWFGPVIHEFYGGTESGSVTFCDSQEALERRGTVGRAIEGARLEVLNDDGSAAAAGVAGEIFMRIGYFPDFTYVGRDDLRREIERDGLITCGDVGYLDADGYLFICDRKRDMVIVGGVNVYPAEIESALTGMPGVRDSAVFGIPHPDYGEELMAVVQPLDGVELEPAEIRAYLAEHIADFKVPRVIELRTELPREDTGKIFKRRLRDPYWQDAGRAI